MKKEHSTIDGFIPRKSGDMLGGLHNADKKKPAKNNKKVFLNTSNNGGKLLHTTGNVANRELGQSDPGRGLGREDIADSLRDIDSFDTPLAKLTRSERKLLKNQKKSQKPRWRRVTKWVLLSLLAIGLAFAGYTAYKFIAAGNNIFQGNILDIFTSQPLRKDSNGRSNFLILGTSEDDPGHEGANLTDSIMVVSVDQVKKDVYMFSIPRDLRVEYGQACPEGYSGKINSYFSCISDGSTNESEQERLTAMRKMVGDITGMDIQYSAHINWKVLVDTINAVGGVDVDIQGSAGAPGVLDRNMDWRCNYSCYLVDYDNGVHHLDGEHALYLSMARGDVEPTYGLSRSNFDREINQQKILMALKEKATSTGMLTNLGAITKVIESLGNNLRTNVQANEVRTLIQAASDIKSGDIHSLSLVDGPEAVMDGSGNPKLGDFEYDDLQKFIKKNLNSDPVSREAAPVAVFNGSGQSGLGKSEADKLSSVGFNVVAIDNAPDENYGAATVYQIGDGNEATAQKLSEKLGVAIKNTKPPVLVTGNVRFVVIFGAATS
ncbi:MAG: LCP family protein [Candidatus Saccharibacteria bacterium]